ncbi:free fatty acid receptor 2-like [Misgurnus anguillicaudatus]|uniref:free fatty acid receptor 2-like n=1 Tax=Misgurnus anguillicaudatus TaxID=75329 RepID=UPI003CCF1561
MAWTVLLSNLVLGIYGFTLITGLPANLLAFYTFCRKIRQRSTPIDVLLLSLTISDLVFLLFLPFRMIEAANMKWTLPNFLCPLSGFIYYSTIYNSTLHLTAISVERYLSVAFPIKYKLKRNPRHAAIAVVFFWLISFAHCSIVYIMRIEYYSVLESTSVCGEEFSNNQLLIHSKVRLEIFIVLFCAPLLICCFCYIKFIHILYNLPHINTMKRMRAIGIALGTLLMFIICFMPFNILQFRRFLGKYEVRLYTLVTCTLNACLDPFIFYFSSSAFRETLKSILRELIRRMAMLSCHSALYCPLLKVRQQRKEHRDLTVPEDVTT